MAIVSRAFGIDRTSHIFEAQYGDTPFDEQHSATLLGANSATNDISTQYDKIQVHCNKIFRKIYEATVLYVIAVIDGQLKAHVLGRRKG